MVETLFSWLHVDHWGEFWWVIFGLAAVPGAVAGL